MKKVHWLESHDKWKNALILVKKHLCFANQSGWHEFYVTFPCGYCNDRDEQDGSEFSFQKSCNGCRLLTLNICDRRNNNNSPFWGFVNTMRELLTLHNSPEYSAVLWFEAEVHAGIILEAIEDHGRELGYLNEK